MGPEVLLIMSLASTAVGAVGGMQEANAIEASGRAAQQQKEYEAAQSAELAKQEFASSQRKNIEEMRKKDMSVSRAITVAGQGGGGLDSGFADIMASLEGEGRYRQELAMYEGYDNELKRKQESDMLKYEGRNAVIAANSQAKSKRLSTAVNTATSLASAGSSYKSATVKKPTTKADITWFKRS